MYFKIKVAHLEDTKGVFSEAVYRRRIDNTMVKSERHKEQTTINKTLYRKLKKLSKLQ